MDVEWILILEAQINPIVRLIRGKFQNKISCNQSVYCARSTDDQSYISPWREIALSPHQSGFLYAH